MYRPQKDPKRTHYDIIIVGAGFAGQSCALTLGGCLKNVLLIEHDQKFHQKVCAGGLTHADLRFIPSQFLESPLQKAYIHYGSQTAVVGKQDGVIAGFDRSAFLQWHLSKLKRFENVETAIGTGVKTILDAHSLVLTNGRTIRFEYLVGADGRNSVVRHYLNLPPKNTALAMQYTTSKKFEHFELFLSDDFESYFWIFPHTCETKIGCVSETSLRTPHQMKSDLNDFMNRHRIPLESATFEAALIGVDYTGYHFDNMFLAGDAAGIVSRLTGKGILPAYVSGTVIGQNILGNHSQDRNLRKLLRKKAILDCFASLLPHRATRKLFFSLGIRVMRYPAIANQVMRLVN